MSAKAEKPIVFIASNSNDRPSCHKIIELLKNDHHVRVVMYESDLVATGQKSLSISYGSNGKLLVEYDNELLDFAAIKAAWYRRPNEFINFDDTLHQLSLAQNYKPLQESLWQTIAPAAWLNAPVAIQKADNKLKQLEMAARLGFTIPQTIVSNTWSAIEQIDSSKLIVKPAGRADMRSKHGDKVVYTTVLDNEPAQFPRQASPYPAIWQAYKAKAREWRITVVGDQLFSAAVYTSAVAKDDWRRHQFTSEISWQSETLPAAEQQLCHDYLKAYGLGYGAFDLVESPQGEITFLEMNPNGQFMFIEQLLGLPISEAIAAELAKIAKTNITLR